MHLFAVVGKWNTWGLNPGSLVPGLLLTSILSYLSVTSGSKEIEKGIGFYSVFFLRVTIFGCLDAVEVTEFQKGNNSKNYY